MLQTDMSFLTQIKFPPLIYRILKRSKKLWVVHAIAASLYALQALLMAWLSIDQSGATRPLSTSYLTTDTLASAAKGSPVLVQGSAQIMSLNMHYILTAIFIILALAQAMAALLARRKLSRKKQGLIKLAIRVGYAVAAAGIISVLAVLAGIYDIVTLLLIYVLVFIMCRTAQSASLVLNQSRPYFKIAVLAAATQLVVIGLYILSAQLYAYGTSMIVYSAYVTLGVTLAAFGVLIYARRKWVGFWNHGAYSEPTIIALALVTLSALGWQLFVGA